MKLLGITGGISTGKSTVSHMLQARGAIVLDADQMAKDVVRKGEKGWHRVVQAFGEQVLCTSGELNRAALGEQVFRYPEKRKQLNHLIHPLVQTELIRQSQEIQEKLSPTVIFWDVPLLIEENWVQAVEALILVYAPHAIQLERLMERDGFTMEEALLRIKAQMPIEDKKTYADYLIDNSGLLENTEEQVDQLWDKLSCQNQ